MDGEFVPVRTWQGFVMVSTSLLPQSFDEKTRIYPHSNLSPDDPRFSNTPPLLQHRDSWTESALAPEALPPPPPPPPVPKYWPHELHDTAAGNGMEPDGRFFYETSSSGNPAVSSSSSAQTFDSVYTWRADDDAASIPKDSSPSSSWDPVVAGFGDGSSGIAWGDAGAVTDLSVFPRAADGYDYFPATNPPAQTVVYLTDGGKKVGSLDHGVGFLSKNCHDSAEAKARSWS